MSPSVPRTISFSSAFRRLRFLVLTAGILFFGASAGAHAQTAHFSYAQSAVGSGLSRPYGVAVDGSGNVYIADAYNSRVLKAPPTDPACATAGDCTTIGSGLNRPSDVAVDGSGNVYIADAINNRVLKVPATDPACATAGDCTTVGSGLSRPSGVAVDGSGNVYIADTNNNRVLKAPPTDPTCATASDCTIIGSSLSDPWGVAVDGSGNVYIADGLNNRILEVPPTDPTCATAGDCTTVGSSLNRPYGVAVDGSGNVYIADTHNSRMLKVPPSDPACATAGDCTTIGSGLNDPVGVAVDGSGNVYIVDTSNNRVLKLQIAGVNFGSVPVGSTSVTQTLAFTFDSTGTLGSLPSVLIQGDSGLDFVDAGTGTCATNGTSHSYAGGDTCTVDVTFTPKFPGERMGVVQLTGSGGAVIATAYIHGIGTAPQVAFAPLTQTTLGSNLNAPAGIALDGAGNTYVVNAGSNSVVKITPSGSQSTVASGLNQPWAVAVDGAGNLYVTSQNTTPPGVTKIAPNGTQATFSTSGTFQIFGAAVDSGGDVYLADSDNSRIVKVTPTGQQTTVPVSGLSSPFGVAVDSAGNLYIADTFNNRVVEVAPGGAETTVPATGLINPTAVSVDAAGDLYIADVGNQRVVELPAGGGAQIDLANGLNYPYSVTVDPTGNVYIADFGNNRVLKLAPRPPSLTFANTNVGATSSDSPQTVTLTNIGNVNLIFAVPTSGMNPSISPVDFTYGNSSTCPQLSITSSSATLAPGGSCTALLGFSPTTAGALAGSVAFTDDSLNASPNTTQSINLGGTGVAIAANIALSEISGNSTYGSSVSATYGANVYVTATVSGSDGTPTGDITYTIDGGSPQSEALSGGTVQFALPTTISAGTHTVQVNYAGDSNYTLAATPQSFTLNVAKATLTVVGDQDRRPYGLPNPTFAVDITGQWNNDTFTVTYATAATQTSPVGTYTVVPTVSGTNLADYDVVTTNGSLQIIPENLFVIADDATRVYGTPNPQFTATVTGAVNGDVFTPTFTTVATQSSDAGRYDITPAVTGADIANYAVIPTVGILTVTQASTNLALTASANQAGPGTSIALTATATTAASGPPSGIVLFYAGGNPIGASTLNAQGVATLTTAHLSAGSNVITASYQETRDFLGSTAQLAAPIVIGTPTFTMTSSTSNIAIQSGQVGTMTLTLTPSFGYTGSVSFECSGLPAKSACSFGSNPVVFDGSGNAVQVTLVLAIGPTGLTRSSDRAMLRAVQPLKGFPILPAIFFWMPEMGWDIERKESTCGEAFSIQRRKSKLAGIFWVALLLTFTAAILGMSGCAGMLPSGPAQGQQTVTVTATGSGNISQSIAVQVTVQ